MDKKWKNSTETRVQEVLAQNPHLRRRGGASDIPKDGYTTVYSSSIKRTAFQNKTHKATKARSSKSGQPLSSTTAAWMRNAICTKLCFPAEGPGPNRRRRFWSDTVRPSVPKASDASAYSSVTDRRLKMGSRRPSKLGDSAPLEEELREQEEVYPSSERESAEEQR